MKKILSWLLAAVILFSLTGCGAGSGGSYQVEITVEPQEEKVQSQTPSFPVGNLERIYWHGIDVRGSCTKDAFYSIVVTPPRDKDTLYSALILRIDYKTLTQDVFCDDPQCAHDSQACPAYLGEYASLVCIGDKLYTKSYGMAFEKNTVIYEIDIPTKTKRFVAELPASWEVHDLAYTDGNAFYGEIYNKDANETQNIRVDIKTGETVIYQRFQTDWIIGSYKNQFVEMIRKGAFSSGLMPDAAQEEAQAVENEKETLICLHDPGTNKRTVIYRVPQWEQIGTNMYAGGSVVVGDVLYWGEPHYTEKSGEIQPFVVYSLDLKTGEIQIQGEFTSTCYLEEEYYPVPTEEKRYLNIRKIDDDVSMLMIDRKTGEVREKSDDRLDDAMGPVVLAYIGDDYCLVPTARFEEWDDVRYEYGIIAIDTLFTGEGEVYPITPWHDPDAMG